jgi:dolichol-phosphate hexosyltransferase
VATISASAPDASGTGRTRLVSERTIDLSILMPVYDERRTVERAISAVLEAKLSASYELIVVDDGSRDGTSDLLNKGSWPEHVHVFSHDRNRGKGAALRTALAEARGTYATILDADLEYLPSDIPLLLEPLMRGDAQAVFGTRAFRSHSAYSFWYVLGNRAVTLVANVIYNCWISDLMTGQKALRTDLFRSLDLRESGFAVEAEIMARLLGRGIRVYEVPVEYRARTREEGKKLTALDGLRVVRTLLRCRIA